MNVRDLHEQLRASFTCVNGTPRAYMEIRVPVPHPEPPHEVYIHHARFVYEAVGVTMRGEPEHIEPILCAWAWQKLIAGFDKERIQDRDVLILFRRWPEVLGYIDSEGYECTKLTMRLVIPAEDLKRIFGEAVCKEGELLFKL